MGSAINSTRERGATRSPFFARTYGGFTRSQAAYFRLHAGPVAGKTVIDPMAGQAVEISMLPLAGANVFLADINPAPLLMAALRHPSLITRHQALHRQLQRVLRKLPDRIGSLDYVDGWFSPGVTEDLQLYSAATGIDRLVRQTKQEVEFWSADVDRLFWVALPLLCARQITCYRTSDNVTWLRPGALSRVHGIRDALQRAATEWLSFAQSASSSEVMGTLSLRRGDATNVMLDMPKANLIVTSPPYANRLDYHSLWSPELAVFGELTNSRWTLDRNTQIGTTIVRGVGLPPSALESLPSRVRETLDAIRRGSAKASDTYYYPFFANYALSLARVIRAMAKQLMRRGKLIVFVRDTVRKDVLFETGQLVEDLLAECGLERVDRQRHVIRQHIGSLRKLSTKGVYGTAQQEWWFAYRKA